MTPTEFEQWCRTLRLEPATCDLIAGMRAAPPARRVSSRANIVSGAYPSRKMGMAIQFESHTVELWAIYLMEHDPDVLEYCGQPHTFKLHYQDNPGRKCMAITTHPISWPCAAMGSGLKNGKRKTSCAAGRDCSSKFRQASGVARDRVGTLRKASIVYGGEEGKGRHAMEHLINRPLLCPKIIGRTPELAALGVLVEQAKGGQGHLALLHGEAGIGKSRLVAETKAAAADLDFLLLQGNCFRSDRFFPYAPLLDLLRAYISTHAVTAARDLQPLAPA